jgi:alkylhydroperoxidase/carboxymuconolactone decarboxylase family protein YurZ
MEKRAEKIIKNLDYIKEESPEYNELAILFKNALKNLSDLDTKVKDLINVVLAMSKQPPDYIEKNIAAAFSDGVGRCDIIIAACLALIQLENADRSVLKPLLESISKYDPVSEYRSDCYWYSN